MDREPHHPSDLFFVTHDDCEPWDQNPRTNANEIDQDMRDLITSVSANGVRQSLSVRTHPDIPGRYQIAAGGRRWYALGHAIGAGARPQDDPLPVRVLALDHFDMLACALEENLQRKPMTCLEEAEAYLELAQHGHRGDRVTATIAERVGKTQRHIQSYIALARDLSPMAKEALTEGRINFEHAKVLTGIPSNEQERFIADQVGSKPLRTDRRVLKALLKPGAPSADLTQAQRASGDSSEALRAPVRSTQPTRRAKDPVRRHAESLRTAAIYQAFTGHPDIGLRIAALDLAGQIETPAPDTKVMKEADTLLSLSSAEERWQLVSALSATKLQKLLIHLLASIIAPKLASLGRTPSLLSLARQALSLKRAAADQLDDALLQPYPKAQLIDLALACGAFSEDRLHDLRQRTPRELRVAILESETRDPEWLPDELRFDRSKDKEPEQVMRKDDAYQSKKST